MNFGKIKHIVYTPEMKNSMFVKSALEEGINCVPIIDARSAMYIATGISAQNQEVVAVCIDGGNASRSAFSGLTEAYYRNLPVVLITYGIKLDYSKELADVTHGHYTVPSESKVVQLLENDLPIHIEIEKTQKLDEKITCERIQNILKSVLEETAYLYIGQGILCQKSYMCKVVEGGMPNCFEGVMANILGASLVKKHSRYIGIMTEKEFVLDINTLGNINVNDSLLFVVVMSKRNSALENFADSLGYEVYIMAEDKVDELFLETVVNSQKKAVLFISEEEG